MPHYHEYEPNDLEKAWQWVGLAALTVVAGLALLASLPIWILPYTIIKVKKRWKITVVTEAERKEKWKTDWFCLCLPC